MFCKNSFMPPYVKPDLKWFERNGLVTYIDRLNYERFENNRDGYLENVKVTNFDMIHNQIKGLPLEKSIKEYKTVTEKDLKQMRLDDQDAAIAACFRSIRKDLNIAKEIRDKCFKEWESSKKFVKDKRNLKSKNQKYFDSW